MGAAVADAIRHRVDIFMALDGPAFLLEQELLGRWVEQAVAGQALVVSTPCRRPSGTGCNVLV
jgi:hypothetical protein